MADDGKTFPITFKTEAELSAAEATERAVSKVADEIEHLEDVLKRATEGGFGNYAADLREQIESLKQKRTALEEAGEAEAAAAEAATAAAAEAKRAADQRKQQEADLEEAIRRRRTREQEAAEREKESHRQRLAAGAALAVAMREIGQVTNQALGEFEKLGVEAPPVFKALQDTIALATDPLETIIDLTTGYKEEIRLLAESQANAAKMEALYLETLKRKQEELAAASRNRIETFLAAEKRAIEENTAAYDRQVRVIKALADAEEARARAADAAAITNGADPNQVAAAALARQGARDSSAIDAKVAAAEKALQDAERLFDAATSAAAQAATSSGITKEQADEASAAAQAAQAAVVDAVAELDTVRTEAAAAKSVIASGAVAEFQGLTREVDGKITKIAEDAAALMKAKAAETGGRLGSLAKGSFDDLAKLIGDSIPDSQQVDLIRQAMENFANSTDAKDRKTYEGLQGMIEAVKKRDAEMDSLLRQVGDLNRNVFGR